MEKNKNAHSKATPTDEVLEENARAPHYDRGIIPAETAARQEREGDKFMDPHPDNTSVETGQTIDPENTIDTTGGYTVDKEGLVDNFAIEPEMYVNEPGDLREEAEEDAARRAHEYEEINDGSRGELTMEGDKRDKGPGLV